MTAMPANQGGDHWELHSRRVRRLQRLQLTALVSVLAISLVVALAFGRALVRSGDAQRVAANDQRELTDISTLLLNIELLVRRGQAAGTTPPTGQLLKLYADFRSGIQLLSERNAGGTAPDAQQAREDVRAALAKTDASIQGLLQRYGPTRVDIYLTKTGAIAEQLTGSLKRWVDAAAVNNAAKAEQGRRLSRQLFWGTLAGMGALALAALGFWWLIDRARERLNAAVVTSEERFRSLVQNSSDVVILLDDDARVMYAAPGIGRLIGRQPSDVIGRPLSKLAVHADGEPNPFDMSADQIAQRETVTWTAQTGGGGTLYLESVVSDHRRDPKVGAIVLNTRDVSERHEMERVLAHRADHDSLTGLVNRDVFARRVSEALAATSDVRLTAVVLIDIDDFKTINDSLGHRVGDTLLVRLAERIRKAVDGECLPARFGGDEFVLLVPDAEGLPAVEALAHSVIAAIGRPIAIEGHDLVLHASAGIATDRDTSDRSPEGMLRDADLAMYGAKQRGPGHVVVYDPLMGEGANRRLELVSHLNHAAERGELSVAYQPIVGLADNRVRGVEALLRWTHPVHGAISPMLFIRLAEETGKIHSLGRWMLERSVADLRKLVAVQPDAADLLLSVNVSTRELEAEDFAAGVAGTLAASGFRADRLMVEVTETAFMRDPETLMRHLDALKDLGVTIAVDDFGTGYSSLAYLARLPIDIVKIDRAFVLNLVEEGRERRIADMIMRIGETLGVRAVAEGIEERSQLDAVRELGCDLAQGYLLGRPMPIEQLRELVRGGLSLEV